MATWGQIKISFCKYNPENNTLYYEYLTSVDSYYIKVNTEEDYGLGNEKYESEYRFGNQVGEAMMEALIHHILAFEYSGDKEEFVKRYLDENRFKAAKVQN